MPSLEDARFNSRARAEQRKKAKALDSAHLVKVILAHKTESLADTSQMRDGWSNDWRLFQGEVDFSDKEDWQSQVWEPKSWAAIMQAQTIIQNSLLESADFFGISGTDQKSKVLADLFFKPLITLAFDKCHLVQKFTDSVGCALATGIGLYLKFRYPSFPVPTLAGVELDPETGQVHPVYSRTRRQFLTVEVVEPWRIYRDPKSKPREQWSGSYIMHEESVDRSFITAGKDGGYFDEKAVNNLLSAGSSNGGTGRNATGPDDEAKRKGQEYNPHEFRKPHQILEWYGDVPDENGDLIFPDAMMHLGDEKELLSKGPIDNPLWTVDINSGRRKWPLIGLTALGHPTRFEGFGILRGVNPSVIMYNNILNLFADGLNWVVNASSEVNRNLLEDWNDLENWPGKLWVKTGSERAIIPAETGKMPVAEVLGAMQFISGTIENNSFVSHFVSGQPGTRRTTKGEVEMKTAQGMGVFMGMGRNIELAGMAAVEMAHDMIAQYMTDFSDPGVQRVVGPMASQILMSMDPAQRMNELDGNFGYLFTGITAALQKSQLLGRIMQAATLFASGPYSGRTDPGDIIKAVVELMGLRDRIQVFDKPMIPLDKAKEIGMQMVQAALGQGGPKKPGGPGGTPPNAPGGRAIRVPPPSIDQLAPAPNEASSAVAT